MVDFQSRDTSRSQSVSDDEPLETPTDGDETSTGDRASERGQSATDDGAVEAPDHIDAAVVTVADARSHDDDPGGDAIVEALEADGHAVTTREVLRASHDTVQQTLDTLASRSDVDAIVTAGGTGVSPDDVTVEAAHPLVETALPGFGELFRRRYAERVGTDVVGSRAMAGIIDGTPIFCLPADPAAARLGTSEIVVEQALKLAEQARSDVAADQ